VTRGELTGRRVALVLGTSTGGVGRHVRSLAEALVARGVRVGVLGPAATEEQFGFTRGGAAFASVPVPAGPRPDATVRAVVALRRAGRGADLVHAHGLRAGLVAALGTAARPAPLVVTWHNLIANPTSSRPRRAAGTAVERVVARQADLTLAASDDLVSRVLELGGRDVRLAPVAAPALPLPTRSPDEVRAELGAAGRPLVLAVGRLHPQKGYDVLVSAAARWVGLDPAPLVALAGSGPLAAPLAAEIGRIGARVRLLGHRDDVGDLLAAADLLVLPSRWEARSLVAQEALRAGVPLVASAVGALPGLVGDAAVLVPAGDVDALDAAVRRLLAAPQERTLLAKRGLDRAASWPTEADTAAQVAAVYAELLGRPQSRRS
jgi:glycosyltransferase involved in cell wall biosynthesis